MQLPIETWQAIITVVVPLLIFGTKFLIPKIPKWSLPILAPILGAGIDIVANWHVGTSALVGAVMGGLGVWLREVKDQVQKAVVTPEPTG